MIEKSAGAVVFRRQDKKIKYLLLHHQLGHWDFPKGNIEKGEKIEGTVRREIKEETGIKDFKFLEGFREWIKYFYRHPKTKETVMKIVTYCLVETKQEKVKLSYEHIGYRWLEFDEALAQLNFENSKEILKKADKFLSELF